MIFNLFVIIIHLLSLQIRLIRWQNFSKFDKYLVQGYLTFTKSSLSSRYESPHNPPESTFLFPASPCTTKIPEISSLSKKRHLTASLTLMQNPSTSSEDTIFFNSCKKEFVFSKLLQTPDGDPTGDLSFKVMVGVVSNGGRFVGVMSASLDNVMEDD